MKGADLLEHSSFMKETSTGPVQPDYGPHFSNLVSFLVFRPWDLLTGDQDQNDKLLTILICSVKRLDRNQKDGHVSPHIY